MLTGTGQNNSLRTLLPKVIYLACRTATFLDIPTEPGTGWIGAIWALIARLKGEREAYTDKPKFHGDHHWSSGSSENRLSWQPLLL